MVLVLTPVFEKLPLNVMGAIVVSGVSGLFEYEQAVHLFKVGRQIKCSDGMCHCVAPMVLAADKSMLSCM
jgi:MFS superfamily sulfate permease-like transporter